MFPVSRPGRWWMLLLFLCSAAGILAHPVPDIPVRGFFQSNGDVRIEIEIDPRVFGEDPVNDPYLVKADLDSMPAPRRAALIEQARKYADEIVTFHFEPTGQFVPKFEFRFDGIGDADLKELADPVMLIGSWTTKLAAGLTGFRIESKPEGKLSLVLVNFIDGIPAHRVNVLFPGESSYVLDLSNLGGVIATTPGAVGFEGGMGATFVEFVRQGFVHVIPLGWDHILFVLGLFLLSRQWRPLLWQVTMFTAAHTLTLGLATLGGLSVPGSIVEPVIAASIAVIALENVFRPKYTRWRLVVVFVFGLIHGLGFAGALQELNLPTPSLLVGLLGFNLGVEFGQLAVITIAWGVTVWLKRDEVYRKMVAVPASLAIAGFGVWWTIQRVMGS